MRLPPFYPVIDEQTARGAGWSVPGLALACLRGGARCIQLRATEASSTELLAWSDEVVAAAREFEATVIINDRADIAMMAGAAGVHVGQLDLEVTSVRRMLPPPAVVGLSTHTADQLAAARQMAVSYVAVGPIYTTSTKETGYDAVGLSLVRHAASATECQVVAIGGVTLARARDVLDAGATSVAVISDLLVDGDPGRRVADYVAALGC